MQFRVVEGNIRDLGQNNRLLVLINASASRITHNGAFDCVRPPRDDLNDANECVCCSLLGAQLDCFGIELDLPKLSDSILELGNFSS